MSGEGVLSFDEFAQLLRRLAPRTSPVHCAAIFAEALRASGPGGGVSPRAFARVAASHGLGLARPPPAVGAAAAVGAARWAAPPPLGTRMQGGG